MSYKPTIKELERLMDNYGSMNVRLMPDGRVLVMGRPITEKGENIVSFNFDSKSRAGGFIAGHNAHDEDGNPAGGWAMDGYFDHSSDATPHFCIRWQDGPIDREANGRRNGAFVEDVLAVLIKRMEFYQNSRFACEENALALHHMEEALAALESRRSDREERGVQGKHES